MTKEEITANAKDSELSGGNLYAIENIYVCVLFMLGNVIQFLNKFGSCFVSSTVQSPLFGTASHKIKYLVHIGYICLVLCPHMCPWMSHSSLTGTRKALRHKLIPPGLGN